jgi:23S rRNA (adenine2503-C2)-methyltransferase
MPDARRDRTETVLDVEQEQAGTPIDLLDLTHDELKVLVKEWGQPAYRADQIWNWLYHQLASEPDEMTSLPKDLRANMAQTTCIGDLKPIAKQASEDRETVKWLFQLPSDPSQRMDRTDPTTQIETVLMSYERRRTACISSQAGCGIGCSFCATGQMGLQRNLTTGEIVAQVLFVARELARQGGALTNVVFMGMGEPFANYDHALAAVRRLINSDGFSMGQRRITVSTVGLVPGIERFGQEGLQVGLAVSLHAATDQLRDTLVPINRRYPLEQLIAACRAYIVQTNRRISFEWALIAGVNDTLEQAHALGERIRGMLCHVNLIPLNPTTGFPGIPSAPGQIAAFRDVLDRYGVANTVRVRRGIDIQAGCGQLRQRMMG